MGEALAPKVGPIHLPSKMCHLSQSSRLQVQVTSSSTMKRVKKMIMRALATILHLAILHNKTASQGETTKNNHQATSIHINNIMPQSQSNIKEIIATMGKVVVQIIRINSRCKKGALILAQRLIISTRPSSARVSRMSYNKCTIAPPRIQARPPSLSQKMEVATLGELIRSRTLGTTVTFSSTISTIWCSSSSSNSSSSSSCSSCRRRRGITIRNSWLFR